jgi:antitoxin HigA-1
MEGDKAAGRPGFRPVHPGRIIKRNIDALSLTVEAFADHIGTSRQTVHAVIAGRSAVREETAVRLARAFKTTPQFWLNLQSNHVVWELERLHVVTDKPIRRRTEMPRLATVASASRARSLHCKGGQCC